MRRADERVCGRSLWPMRWVDASASALIAIAGAACGSPTSERPSLGDDAPLAPDDPLVCKGCHNEHYQQWLLSRHAAAGTDPVFVAMNDRGQRETGGALGDFCVRCHAPLAVARGATSDGRNLSTLRAGLVGITCVVCHSGIVTGNGSFGLLEDGVMRGPIANPMVTAAHDAAYAADHDRDRPESASFCGSCHSVTNQHGIDVERTFEEWRATTYAEPGQLRTCGHCHMAQSVGVAANVALAPVRNVHDHSMPAVDFDPASAPERKLVQETLDPAISARLCVVPSAVGAETQVTLRNALVGHDWPSGATHNRRAWLELVAYSGSTIIDSTGLVAPDEAVTQSANLPLVFLREELYDERSNPTLFMWRARSVQSTLLAPATADPAGSIATATVSWGPGVDRVSVRVLLRALDHDVADALVSSGDLDPRFAADLPTLTVAATVIEWTSERGAACLPERVNHPRRLAW
jgi:cytochrome c554/c'-like protein